MRIGAFITSLILTIALICVHAVRLEGLRYERLAWQAANLAESTTIIGDGLPVAEYALKGLAVNPFNINLHGHAGAAFTVIGQYKKAIFHLDTMLKYYPNHLNSIINQMYAYYYNGNLPKAFEMRDRLARIKPSYVKKEVAK